MPTSSTPYPMAYEKTPIMSSTDLRRRADCIDATASSAGYDHCWW